MIHWAQDLATTNGVDILRYHRYGQRLFDNTAGTLVSPMLWKNPALEAYTTKKIPQS